MDYSIKTTHKHGLSDIVIAALDKKSTEPVQRMVGGVFGYAHHRFQIKGGISVREVMIERIGRPNALLARLISKKESARNHGAA